MAAKVTQLTEQELRHMGALDEIREAARETRWCECGHLCIGHKTDGKLACMVSGCGCQRFRAKKAREHEATER